MTESPATGLRIEDLLFVGTHGHVLALEKAGGNLVWSTSLPGTGYSVVAILVEDDVLLCGSGGRIFALDPRSGEVLWSNVLKGFGTGVVYLTTSRSNVSQTLMSLLGQQQQDDEAAAAGGATAT